MKGFDHPETTTTWDRLYYGDPLSIRFYDLAVGKLLALLEPRTGERILDAGCGAGVHAVRSARAGFEVDAIDFSESALGEAARRAKDAGLSDRIRFSVGDLTRLGMPDGAYRRIFSWGVLIHIPEIEKAMDELVRILADGGRLALYVSNQGCLQFRAGQIKRRLLGKSAVMQRLPMGFATRADLHGESIWVWFNDIEAMVAYLRRRNLHLIERLPGEFCDLHLRFSGFLRRLFLRLNNAWLDFRLPASLAYMNLLVFEKRAPGTSEAKA